MWVQGQEVRFIKVEIYLGRYDKKIGIYAKTSDNDEVWNLRRVRRKGRS